MVAALLSLRLTLLRNELARTRAQRWTTTALVAALAAGTVAGVALVLARGVDAAAHPREVVLLGAGVVIGWGAAPLLALGGDGALTAATLRAYPVARRDQLVGLALASFVGLPGLATLAATVLLTAAWAPQPALLLPAALAGAVGCALAALTHRCVLDGLALVAATRRAREVVGGVVLAAAALALPAWLLVFGRRSPVDVLRTTDTAEALAWTPAGAPWAVTSALARDDGSAAAAYAAVAVAGVALTCAAWWWVLGRLAAPAPARRPRGRTRRLGAFAWTPDSVRGAVAARTLTSWVRDPRSSQTLVFGLLLPVMGLGVDVLADAPGLVLVNVVVAVLLVAGGGALDVSHDSTAFAAHLSAGVRGRDDRAGRLLAHAVVSAPVVLVGLLVAAPRVPAAALPGLAGVLVAVAAGACAAGAVTSALVTVPTPPPGASGSRPGSGPPTALLYAGATGAALAVAAVPSVLALVGLATGRPGLGVAALGAGALLGLAACAVGVRVGGRLLDRRGRRLYAALVQHA